MKYALVTLAGLVLCLAAPAAAHPVLTSSPVQAPTLSDLDTRLDAAWSDLNAKWMSGQISDREFQIVTDLLIQIEAASKTIYPEAGTVRHRLQQALEDLKARAARAAKNAAYVDSVYEQIIDSRVGRYLSMLKTKAAAGGTTPDDWQALVDQLNKRALAAKDDGEASAVAARFKAMVDQLMKKAIAAALTASDFQPFELEFAEERLVRTVTWLKVRIAIKGTTHFDYVRVGDVVRDRGTIAASAPDAFKAWQDAIDRLEAIVGNDKMTPDEFAKFMYTLGVRVRGALKA